jgi:chemotaxis signal transduction protein
VQPPPPIGSEEAQRFLSGLVHLNERVLILLNLPEIFDLTEISRVVNAA